MQAWQKKFRYILIDEFQDVNQLQYDIVRLLALPENNLFLVGDDDQSIYRFRGARPEIMLQIPKDFPQLKQVILKQNYRCTGEIVEKSQNVIRWNDARYEKQLFTEKVASNTMQRLLQKPIEWDDCRKTGTLLYERRDSDNVS